MTKTAYEFDACFKRLLDCTGAHNQSELADALGIRQSSVADGKRRNAIPAAWVLKMVIDYGINPEWIATGQGFKHLVPSMFSGKNMQIEAFEGIKQC